MCEFGLKFGLILAGLALFGISYNWVIGYFERKGYLEGYTALAVVLGVLVTLGAVALVDWLAAVLCLAAFCASGVPMLGGSIWRHMQARRAEIEAERQAQQRREFLERLR
jgi:hypothetical protein